jgi:hypothetical protein
MASSIVEKLPGDRYVKPARTLDLHVELGWPHFGRRNSRINAWSGDKPNGRYTGAMVELVSVT